MRQNVCGPFRNNVIVKILNPALFFLFLFFFNRFFSIKLGNSLLFLEYFNGQNDFLLIEVMILLGREL